jgi:hypothetical protein
MDVRTATAAGALRWARAAVLATVALLTGTLAHVSAGHALPSVSALGALLAVLTLVAAPLLRHPASTRRVVLLVAAGETLIHYALSASTPAAGHLTGRMTGLMTGPMASMHHATGTGVVPGGSLTLTDILHQAASGATGPHVLMAEAHLAAAVLLGLWLAAGERALWTVLCLTLATVVTAAATLAGSTSMYLGNLLEHVSDATAGIRPVMPHAWALASRVVTRRGPPVGSSRPLRA